jgi:hypothetical protein
MRVVAMGCCGVGGVAGQVWSSEVVGKGGPGVIAIVVGERVGVEVWYWVVMGEGAGMGEGGEPVHGHGWLQVREQAQVSGHGHGGHWR